MEGQELTHEAGTSPIPQPQEQAAVTYPKPGTQPDHFFESAQDELMKVETISYPNGGKSKRAVLSDGRIAVSRRLKGHDMVEASKVAAGNQEKVQPAVAAIATKVNDQPIVIEQLLDMWGDDFNVIKYMSSDLNF